MDEIKTWHAMIVFQSGAEIATIRTNLRRNGDSEAAVVFVVADVTDPASRFFMQELQPSFAEEDQAFVGAVPTADVVRVLRLMSVNDVATEVEALPRRKGTIRVVAVGKGRVTSCDLEPDLVPPSGFNTSGGTA